MNFSEFYTEQQAKLDEVYNSLSSETIDTEEIKTKIKNVVDSTAQYGKTNYDKKAGQLRSVFEEIGYNPDSGIPMKEYISTLKNNDEKLSNTEHEYRQLSERLKRLEAEREAERVSSEKMKREHDELNIFNKLNEAIGGKLTGAKYVIKDLIREGSVKIIDGSVMFVNGDDYIMFDDGVKTVMANNEDLIINDQIAGVGSSRTNSNVRDNSQLSLDKLNKMSQSEIKARMSDIKKLAGMR